MKDLTREKALAEGVKWIRTRPKSTHAAMIRFPPGCTVKATKPLFCPAPGEVARVYSYGEDGHVTVEAVREEGGEQIAWHVGCDPDWLEVVETPVFTSADVKRILEKKP